MNRNTAVTQTGLERLLESDYRKFTDMRLGLVTNPSGVDHAFRFAVDLIHEHPELNLTTCFAPEHGIRGEAQAGDHITNQTDARTGLPVYSLHGETREPTDEMLANVDAVLFDVQDIGVRFTTYISSLHNLMVACHRNNKQVIVLDRPNPLGGVDVAGGVLDPEFRSFVGTWSIPVLHGLTLGEFAMLVAAEQDLTPPQVIQMRGWKRHFRYHDTGLSWILPSPNLPTFSSLACFPGTCFIEGTTLSEGRGTTTPFEVFGAPGIDPEQLAHRLSFPGVRVRPMYFTPTFSKHQGEVCAGVMLYMGMQTIPRMPYIGAQILKRLHDFYPEQFDWREPFNNRHFIDLLAGTDALRTAIDAEGESELSSLLAQWEVEASEFEERRKPFLLYDS